MEVDGWCFCCASSNSVCPYVIHARISKMAIHEVLFVSQGTGKCIEEERRALLDFKKGLKDFDDLLSSWKADDRDCCRWRGIVCYNRTAQVISLDLRPTVYESNDVGSYWSPLEGELRPSLLQLPFLIHLDLSLNFFAIPDFIGSLSRLRYLNFSQNTISGRIPSHLGNLSRLRTLDLSSNNFSGEIPSELGDLYTLKYLDLSLNLGFLTVDNFGWLSHLSSLRELKMSAVNFTNAGNWLQSIRSSPTLSTLNMIDSEFGDIDLPSLSKANSSNSLKSITFTGCSIHSSVLPLLINISSAVVDFRLSNNQLTGPFLDAFTNLDSLQHLYLSKNNIQGPIPKSLGNLCKLQTFDVSENNLSEPVDGVLESLGAGCARTSLQIINLSYNKLKGLLPNITRLTSLRELYLNDNLLEGFSPDCTFAPSSWIFVLHMARNKLTTGVPESIGVLSNLRVLLLQSNNLVGKMTEVHFKNLFNLLIFDLSFNPLALNLSSYWVLPFQLVSLNLRSCKLGPGFPNWLRRQTNFSRLDISDSEISDTVPSWFWNNLPSKLRYLNISYNSLKGKVPNLRYEFAYSPAFDFSFNWFYGPIPQFLSSAAVLSLANNNFSGNLSFLCRTNSSDLSYLDLSNNSLLGNLPDCWMNVSKLVIIDLGNNKLSGMIPDSLGWLEQIQSLRLRNNSFAGGLPSSLKNCSRLQLLDVGENKLTGPIPAWLGQNVTDLVVLRLRDNRFYDEIPETLCRLTSLQLLDLSLNNISGAIPYCVNNLTAMTNNVGKDRFRGALWYYYYYSDVSFDSNSVEVLNYGGVYEDSSWIIWKGGNHEYKNNLGLLKMIDLSSNALSGEIPGQMTSLFGLLALNLSRNMLPGRIPGHIGQFERLESLDLSGNQLSGEIPGSLANLTFLSVLDLSNNTLYGPIPLSTQLQSFNASSYAGNPKLCGRPLPNKCAGSGSGSVSGPSSPADGRDNDSKDEELFGTVWFYSGLAVGFVVGFWAVFGALVLKRSLRVRFFGYLDNLSDCLYQRH